jgi:hypothetical protein
VLIRLLDRALRGDGFAGESLLLHRDQRERTAVPGLWETRYFMEGGVGWRGQWSRLGVPRFDGQG